MNIAGLLLIVRAMQRSDALDLFPVGALAQTRDRAASSACVGNRFRPSGRLEYIGWLRRCPRRGASVGERCLTFNSRLSSAFKAHRFRSPPRVSNSTCGTGLATKQVLPSSKYPGQIFFINREADNVYLPRCCGKLDGRISSSKVRSVNSISPVLLASGYRPPMASLGRRNRNNKCRCLNCRTPKSESSASHG